MLLLRRLVGVVLVIVGLSMALFPVISVWRASGQVLDLLPSVAGAEVADQRYRIMAMFDPDFVLAQRTFTGVEAEAVTDALLAGGYAQNTMSSRWGDEIFSRECCGDYDAAWVALDDERAGSVVARLTMADSDIQYAWPIFGFAGSVLTLTGLVLIFLPSRRRAGVERPDAGTHL